MKATTPDTLHPIRDLSERRSKLDTMYAMLQHAAQHTGPEGMILGEGFFIAHLMEENGTEIFNVFRRGYGMERVKSLTRVSTLFTPDMFIDGIQ